MARAVVLALAVLAASCSSKSTATVDATPDALSVACVEAETHSDLAWIQGEVFDKQCEFSGCHGSDSGGNTGRQSLQDGDTIGSLVNQKSNLESAQTLVIPNDSADSYMMVMLGSVPGTIPATDAANDPIGTMPLDTNGELLCQEKRDAIARWIDAGAMDD